MSNGTHKWAIDIDYQSSDKSGIMWGIIEADKKDLFKNCSLNLLNSHVNGSGGTQLIYPRYGDKMQKVKSYSFGLKKKIAMELDFNKDTFKIYEDKIDPSNLLVQSNITTNSLKDKKFLAIVALYYKGSKVTLS